MNTQKCQTKWRVPGVLLFGSGLALLLLFGMSISAGQVRARPGPQLPQAWTAAEPIPQKTTNYAFAQCVDDPDGFYVIGGGQAQGDPIDDAWHYDAASDTWTELESLPVALIHPAAACYEGKIYTAGGWQLPEPHVTDNLFIYDIASDSWTQGPDLPHVLWLASMGAWDDRLYLVGGTTGIYPNVTPINHVDVYDIAAGTWTDQSGAPMPVAARTSGNAQVSSYLFVVGGGGTGSHVNATQRYDMAADTWESGPTFTSARNAPGLAATSTHLYAMGGDVDPSTSLDLTDLVETLDYSLWPGSSWSDLGDPLPDTYGGNFGGFCTEAVTGGEIWSVGGAITGAPTITNTNHYRSAEPCADFYFGNLALENSADSGTPGETVTYSLTIDNNGTLADTYDITNSASWTTTYSATIGPLAPGESAALVVEVTVPADAVLDEQDLATVTATSQGDPTASDQAVLTTTALVSYDVDCSADSTALSGFAGQTVTYTLTVTNEGNITDTIDLSPSGYSWTTQLSQTQVTLSASESTQVVVSVTIPEGAAGGEVDTATVTVSSQGDPQTTDIATLTTTALATLKIYLPWVEKE